MNKARPDDPQLQRLREEAEQLPDCSARNLVYERLATVAENLGDFDTAWSARLSILASTSTHNDPSFATLFLNLAWCLTQSDTDPERFPVRSVLWQYKWIATQAPCYAAVPRGVLERLVDDMEQRFVAAGWGTRAGLQKRIELCMLLGDYTAALSGVERWRTARRDRGSDCDACEATTLVELHLLLGRDADALREARDIVNGKLRCSTVPHSTFGHLLLPLEALGRRDEAASIFDRGVRLLSEMESGATKISGPYLVYAAARRPTDFAVGLLRLRIRQSRDLRNDEDRCQWFSCAAVALELLAKRGVASIDTSIAGADADTRASEMATNVLASQFATTAATHASLLDGRNGNRSRSERLEGWRQAWLGVV